MPGANVAALRRKLYPHGLDITAPTSLEAYNRLAAPTYDLPAPVGVPNPAVVVIANSRALWEPFIRSLVHAAHAHPAVHPEPHPLDAYVERCVRAALGDDPDVRFAHETQVGRRFCARAAAAAAGLGSVDETSQLLVHPQLGPWISVRAVVVTTAPAASAAATAAATSPPLLPSRTSGVPNREMTWRELVDVRDSLAGGGRMWRHAHDQIEYHYTANPHVLRRAVARAMECRQAVLDSLRCCLALVPPGGKAAILLRGGVDSSALLQAAAAGGERVTAGTVTLAITVSAREGGSDLPHAQRVTASVTGVSHEQLVASSDDTLAEVGWVCEVLGTRDPMEVGNAIVVALALKRAKALGCVAVVTGDGADEVFGGCDFTHNLPADEFSAQRTSMLANMSFCTGRMGAALGVRILQPYLGREVVDFANSCTPDELVGLSSRPASDRRSLEPTKVGSRILRRAFPECSPVARAKAPTKSGAGPTRRR
jgi:hypothetical protein